MITFANSPIGMEGIRAIRRALLIGLDSFGEVERVASEFHGYEKMGMTPADGLLPIHPTGSPCTIGEFAAALRELEGLEDELREVIAVQHQAETQLARIGGAA